MIIMPSNNTGYVVKDLFKKYPDKLALLLNPDKVCKSQFIFPYAMDNAAFKRFNEKRFFEMLETSRNYHKPMFVVLPDVVGCHYRTIALWQYYYPIIKKYDYPMAFVAQDGCEPQNIPSNADWIFVGGLDPWKMDNVHKFIGNRPVHVGRVNSLERLEYCESIGVTSVDGTGWMRARDKKFYDLLEWFSGEKKQLSLFN